MKTIRLFICGALLLFMGAAHLNAQTNLISNGGFETLDANGLPTGWTIEEGNTISASPDDKQTGSYALRASCQWSETIGPMMNFYSTYSTDSIRAGETYVLSFKYKSLQQTTTDPTWSNDANYNFLKLYCNLLPAITQSKYPAGLRNYTLDEMFGEWLSYEVEFTVPDKKPAYVIRFGIDAARGTKSDEKKLLNTEYEIGSSGYDLFVAKKENQTFRKVPVARNDTNIVRIIKVKNGVAIPEDHKIFVPKDNHIELSFEY
jgi:hypothetical protein